MVQQDVKTVKKHLRLIISTHQRNWDDRLPTLLLAYRASTHKTTSTIPASMVLRRKLCLSCNL
jgi:hypothetical protein